MPSSFFKSLVCLALIVWVTSTARAAVTPYFVTDLGSLGGDSVAYAINNHGQVVGTSGSKAFIWDAVNGMRELQGLGGDYTYAYAINDAGTAVGGAWTADNAIHATMWASQLTPTDISPGPNQTSTAYGINAGGAIVIQSVPDGSKGTRMVIRSPSGQMTDWGTLGGANAAAWGINDAGFVALQWEAQGLTTGYPNVWDPNNGLLFLKMPEGSATSAIFAINNDGKAVGATVLKDQPGGWRAITWRRDEVRWPPNDLPGFTTVLGTLGGATIAWAINDLGRIVGASSIDPTSSDDLTMRAFVEHGSNIIDLNTLLAGGGGWLLVSAQDVNEKGQIVGWGVNPEGQRHAFLLTPVPEPAAVGLMLTGLGALILRRRASRPTPGARTIPRPVPRVPHRARASYTLLEMVVTTSVAVAGMTLFLPAINQARQSSTVLSCQHNAKFLCDAALGYAAEHQNIMVPDERKPAYKISNGNVVPNNDYGWVTSHITKIEERKLSWFGILEDSGHIQSEDLNRVLCPVIPNDHRRRASLNRETGVYAWPTDYVINSLGANASIEAAEEPARNVMFAEPNMDRGAVNYMVLSIEPGTYGEGRIDLEQRRAGSLSFGFVDGHAARVKVPQYFKNGSGASKLILMASYPELALSLGSPPKGMAAAYNNILWWHRGNVAGTGSDAQLTTIRHQPPNNLTVARTLPPE